MTILKRTRKRILDTARIGLVAGLVALAAAATVSGAHAADTECGDATLTIARMPWPSGELLSRIHALIVEKSYGCTVQLVPGDLSGTTSSMTTSGQPLVAPELWIAQVAALWNSGLEADRVRAAGPSYAGGPVEGWFVPAYVLKANPGLKSIADIAANWQAFRPQGAQQGRFLSCPQAWACNLINANLIAALGLGSRFEVETPANRYGLDQALAGAVSRKEPFVSYYWQPNGLIAQLDLKPLGMGDYDPDAEKCLASRSCANPKPSAFAPEPVITAISADLFTSAPALAIYFQRARMPLAEMNALLAWKDENAASLADTAAHFVKDREDVWAPWVAR